jgi:hypothetical protein
MENKKIKNIFKIAVAVFMVAVFIFSGQVKAVVKTSAQTLVKPAIATKAPLILPVPFTSQAPNAKWQDQRQQDGCEEATALMAMAWVKGEKVKNNISKKVWEKSIIDLSNFEQKKYGEYRDISLSDMITWIFKDYFKYNKVSLKSVASAKDILIELEKGNLVLIPMNGQELKNPNFKSPGPLTHMLLVKGYDYKTKEFITNDPGTRKGENYRYSEKIIYKAIRVYPTGYHLKVKKIDKSMIVVTKVAAK